MKQRAKVVLENGALMAEIIRPEACEACKACKHGRTERMLVPLPKGRFQVGDLVELTLPDGQVGVASLLAYGIPFAFFVLGLWLGGMIWGTELGQALGAVAMAAVGFLLIKILDPIIRRRGKFAPTAAPCTMYSDKES